ncbi:rhamnogalacturonan acetylesterase [Flavobacterium sp. GA093]|uniref:Rhamnogalacturonan acetylesterase n=1 Tax=Flavobacterium hydrocarbonoxydans TaxID=2683249 RepID=A0A6I4NSE7_9FLAO|nr:rhamnogalacturonan acetylesterase [Flavobacterium hydrocarbonoxydans]MWB94044.1 rhamnogalacturonan acetylesterase [Flavobacterium hydrocarbonoxydans]
MIKIKTSLLIIFCFTTQINLFALNTNTSTKPTPSENTKSQLFNFGTQSKNKKGILINTALIYNEATGYGFDINSASNVKINSNTFSSLKPAYFSVKLPEGNYQIEVVMGNSEKKSNVTIKAESRRLMLDQLVIHKGKTVTKVFNVNVRTPKIDDNQNVSLKDREKDIFNWDDKLTLEFLGDVHIQSIKITPKDNLTVVYLAGDSTVTDQDVEPWASWGQFITNYLDDSVVVANYAVSGSALSSFRGGNRLKKILSLIKKGDYLFVEFAHNDEKIKGEGNGAWGSYSTLLAEFVQAAKDKGAIPVLVTPTQRRFFNENGTLKETHGDFPAAMRAVAQKNAVALIDVTKMTTELYEAWGDEPSRKAFVQYPANTFPGQVKALEDNTHFNSFGANEIALCVVKGIRELDIPLKKQIQKEVPNYNPKKPNYFSSWTLPMSDRFEITKPDGN